MTAITGRAGIRRPRWQRTRRHRLRLVHDAEQLAVRSKRAGVDLASGQFGLGAAFAVLVVVLSLIGSVMILSASSVAAIDMGGSSFSVFFRQCAWLAVGLAGLVAAARFDYHRWARAVPLLILGSVVLLGLVLVPGIGISVNGARRWIGYGSFQLQPAEPAKLAVIVFIAALAARDAERVRDVRVVLRPVLVVVAVFAALIMAQPNLGTTVVLCVTAGIMLLRCGIPLRALAVISAVGAVAGTYFALSADYRRARITAFLDPWENAGDIGYQTIQSLIGVASGGVDGTGLGASRAKWGFLPEAHTDFIFAIIGEELGLVGSLMVVGIFAAMIVLGLRIAARASDMFGTMVATGVVAWFSVQAFVNVGAVLGILPITGVPLPFVSFGGSSLLFTMVAAGVLVNIALQGEGPADTAQDKIRARIAARRAQNARRHAAGGVTARATTGPVTGARPRA